MAQWIIWKRDPGIPEPHWRTRASKRFRASLPPAEAQALDNARPQWQAARDVLRRAGRTAFPPNDPDVQRHAERVRDGRLLHAVVVDDRGNLLDGEHRVSLVFHRNPNEKVPVLVARPESEGSEMAKKSKKQQKSEQRPSDVSSWRTYASPSNAIDEAVAGGNSDADDEALNAEYNRIKSDVEDVSNFEAMARAYRRAGGGGVAKADDPDDGLGSAITELRGELRKSDLTPHRREVLERANRRAQQLYLAQQRPWDTRGVEDIKKADADEALLRKVELIKRDAPGLSDMQAMREAARDHR